MFIISCQLIPGDLYWENIPRTAITFANILTRNGGLLFDLSRTSSWLSGVSYCVLLLLAVAVSKTVPPKPVEKPPTKHTPAPRPTPPPVVKPPSHPLPALVHSVATSHAPVAQTPQQIPQPAQQKQASNLGTTAQQPPVTHAAAARPTATVPPRQIPSFTPKPQTSVASMLRSQPSVPSPKPSSILSSTIAATPKTTISGVTEKPSVPTTSKCFIGVFILPAPASLSVCKFSLHCLVRRMKQLIMNTQQLIKDEKQNFPNLFTRKLWTFWENSAVHHIVCLGPRGLMVIMLGWISESPRNKIIASGRTVVVGKSCRVCSLPGSPGISWSLGFFF